MGITVTENKFNVTVADDVISVVSIGIQGVQGVQGITGDTGEGVPIGGTAGQVLSKIDATDFNIEWQTGIGITDHDGLTNNGGAGSHAAIDLHLIDTSIHFTESSISITKSQVSDFSDGDYATAAQGTLADSATQPLDNISTLTNDSGFISTISGESVGDLNDVSVTASASGHVLIYGGSPAEFSNRLLLESDISNFGSYEPADAALQIHLTEDTKHRKINDAGTLTTELFSASKIIADYATAAQGTLADSATQPLDNVSTLTNDAGYLTAFTETDPVFLAQKGAANGVATLGADSKIPSTQIPVSAITNTFVVANEAEMLALGTGSPIPAETGDVAVRTDISESFILQGSDASVLGNWVKLLTPTDTVLSVNTQTGVVVLSTSDISEGTNLYYTEARVSANTNVAAATTHIADATKHRLINDAGTTTTELFSASKIIADYATAAQGTLADSATQPLDNVSTLTNDAGYLTAFTETNDLTAAVTWTNVPDANITETSVTQHEGALSIAHTQITGETWISDITASPLSELSNVTITSNTSGEILKWSGTAWINNTLVEAGIAAATHNHDADYAAKESTLNTQTGTTYTLVLTDADTKIIEMNNAAANTLTVPPNSSVAFPIGSKIDIVQYGAGATTVAQGAGVTVRTAETLVLDGQYSGATLYKRATDEWVLIGRLVAA